MSKIQSVVMRNVGAVKDLEINLGGEHVLVSAPNGSGKTTFTNLLVMVLEKRMPKDIITFGEKESFAKITLDNNTVISWEKSTKEKLTIVYPDGHKVINPTGKAISALVPPVFDIQKDFVSKTKAERRKILSTLAGVDSDKLDEAVKIAETNATEEGRTVKHWQAQVVPCDLTLSKEKPVTIEDANKSVHNLVEKQAKQELNKQKFADEEIKIKALISLEASLDTEIDILNKSIEAKKSQKANTIAERKAKSATVEQYRKVVEGYKDLTANIKNAKEAVNGVVARNKAIDNAVSAVKINARLNEAEEQHAIAKTAVETARAARTVAMTEPLAKLGLKLNTGNTSLLFTDRKGVTLDIESANSAELILIAAQINANLMKDSSIKMLPVDVSLLDSANRKRLYQLAADNDLQVFAEEMKLDGSLKVEVTNA